MHKNKNAVFCVVEVIQNCYHTEIGSVVDPSVRCEDSRLSMVPVGCLYFLLCCNCHIFREIDVQNNGFGLIGVLLGIK